MCPFHVALVDSPGLADLDEVPNLMYRWARPRPAGLERSAGDVGWGLALIVSLALLASLVLVGYTLDRYREHLRLGGAGNRVLWQSPVVAVALTFAWMRTKGELCRSVWACTFIPLLHIGWLALVQVIWLELSTEPSIRDDLWLVPHVPAGTIVSLVALALLAALWWERRRPSRDLMKWLRPLFVFCLGFLLILGLWLPLASHEFGTRYLPHSDDADQMVLSLLLGSAAAAGCVAWGSTSGVVGRLLRSLRAKLLLGTSFAFVLAVGVVDRADCDGYEADAYANFVPVLLCAAAVAMLCVAAMGASHWRSLHGRRRSSIEGGSLEGIAVACSEDADSIGRLRYLGWLRGFRLESDAFLLRTRHGDIPVPAGARLTAPLPTSSTRAMRGDTMAVLRAGDRVRVDGLVIPEGDGVYRTTALPVAGASGLIVSVDRGATSAWTQLTLATWRFVVLYLLVSALVLLPGLAAIGAV